MTASTDAGLLHARAAFENFQAQRTVETLNREDIYPDRLLDPSLSEPDDVILWMGHLVRRWVAVRIAIAWGDHQRLRDALEQVMTWDTGPDDIGAALQSLGQLYPPGFSTEVLDEFEDEVAEAELSLCVEDHDQTEPAVAA